MGNFAKFLNDETNNQTLLANFNTYARKADGNLSRIFNELPSPPYLQPFIKSYFPDGIIDVEKLHENSSLVEKLVNTKEANLDPRAKKQKFDDILHQCGGTNFINFMTLAWGIAYYEIIDPATNTIRSDLQACFPATSDLEPSNFAYNLIFSYYINLVGSLATDEITTLLLTTPGLYSDIPPCLSAYINEMQNLFKNLKDIQNFVEQSNAKLEYSLLQLQLFSMQNLLSIEKAVKHVLETIKQASPEINSNLLADYASAAVALIENLGNTDKQQDFKTVISRLDQSCSLARKLACAGIFLLGAVIVAVSIGLAIATAGGSLFAGALALGILAKSGAVCGIALGLGVATIGSDEIYHRRNPPIAHLLAYSGRNLFNITSSAEVIKQSADTVLSMQ